MEEKPCRGRQKRRNRHLFSALVAFLFQIGPHKNNLETESYESTAHDTTVIGNVRTVLYINAYRNGLYISDKLRVPYY